MREKIIQYLQGIQCEWFPVEWDQFVYNSLGIQVGWNESELKGLKIKYGFARDFYYIDFLSEHIDATRGSHTVAHHYFTLDRCKTLLRNAVRSIDEPKRRGDGINIEGNGHHSGYTVATGGELIQIYYHTKDGASIAWENGEFKWNTK